MLNTFRYNKHFSRLDKDIPVTKITQNPLNYDKGFVGFG